MAEKASCPTDILIDIGDENEKFEIIEPLPPEEYNPDEDRLCGYLAKVSQGGFMKGSKTRWFAFNKETCTLNYYRSPKDTSGNPLGSIPISNSAFTCTAEGLLVNSFQIMHDARTHILQACDQKTMLWWLQELQTERRIFNSQQTQRSTSVRKQRAETESEPAVLTIDDKETASGLIDKLPKENEDRNRDIAANRDSLSVIPVLPRIENPPDTVGIKSAHLKQGSSGLPGLTDLGSKVTQLGEGIAKMRIKPPRPAPPAPSSVFYARQNNPNSDEHLTLGPAIKAARNTETKHKRPRARTTAGITHLLDKIQTTVKSGGKLFHHDSKEVEEISETLNLVKEEMELMKTSLESKEETIELLKKELDMYSTLSTTHTSTTNPVSTTTGFEDPGSPSSHHKMRSEITTLKLTIEHLREEVEETKLSLKQQEEKSKLFQEMLQVKDGIVVQLTNELYEMEKSYKSLVNEHQASGNVSEKDSTSTDNNSSTQQLSTSTSSVVNNTSNSEFMNEFKKVKDEVEGYRLQNKFLNNEILELTHLRKVDEDKMDSLHDKILHQEALHCQLQSKYFILLSEMDRNRSETIVYNDTENPLLHQEEGSGKPNVVKQLIQEAIKEGESRAEEISSSFKSSKYDKYGFTQVVDDGDESTFLSAASRLEQHASNIVNSIEQHDATVANKWQKYIAENKEWQRNGEFKSLVRQGIPHDLRHKVWRYLVHIRTYELRQQLNSDGTYYTRLTETPVAPLHAKQIDLDLLRTLPNNRFFATMDCVGIQQLKRVLGAYSLHNPSIGYCQGLNRMAAVSLLYLGEEDAFWCLVAIVECIMPSEYYTSTLTASQADQRVFRDLLAEKLPRLHRHLENMGIDLSLITFNWFLCVYCDNVPPETMFRIWDIFLNESSKVLFRYGLAFFKHVEEDILELNDYMTLFNLLRRMNHRMYDTRALTQIAFQGMNPFPMKKIRRFRLVHMEKVRGELHQLDLLRSEFASRRNKASSNSDMYSDDEGDD